jgi:type IV secretory pathway VirB3-like protein
MLSTLMCIDAHTFWGIPLFILVHLIMVRLSTKEPNFFSIYAKSFYKTPPVMNYWYWGRTNSYEPW